MAVLTGVAPREWIADPYALATAVDVLERVAKARSRGG